MWGAARVGKMCNIPVVWQCNDPIYKWEDGRSKGKSALGENVSRFFRNLSIHVEKYFSRNLTGTMVLDHRVQEILAERYDLSSQVVRGGVQPTRFQVNREMEHRNVKRAIYGIPEHATVILCVSLLAWWRRVEDLVQAFSHLRNEDAWLVLAAPGGDREVRESVEQAIACAPNRVRIIWRREPFKNENELLDLYALSDILAFPNVQQTWGLTPLEAGAAGLALVVSRGAGVSEVLTHEEDALLFEGGNVGQMGKQLERLVNSPALRARLGAAVQEKIRTQLSTSSYAEEALGILQNAVTYRSSNATMRPKVFE